MNLGRAARWSLRRFAGLFDGLVREAVDRAEARTGLRHRIIGPEESPLMVRTDLWQRASQRTRLSLHRFLRADRDQELHSHPWWGLSLVLAGGYWEERRVGTTDVVRRIWRGPGTLYWVAPGTFHRVARVPDDSCITLFLAGPVVSRWGFWHPITRVETPSEDFGGSS